MRHLNKIIKNLFFIVLLLLTFTQVWSPLFSNKLNAAFAANSHIFSKSEREYLSSVSFTQNGSESILGINKVEQVDQLSTPQIVSSDPRVIAMRKFLIDYHSPLYPYANVFVEEADKHGLDWRLIVSISGVESAFGNLIPYRSNNAWGWKGDPTREWSHFSSWRQAITIITERMAKGYGTDLTPFDIESTYCPPCGQNPQHAWANGVTNFMNELDEYVKSL